MTKPVLLYDILFPRGDQLDWADEHDHWNSTLYYQGGDYDVARFKGYTASYYEVTDYSDGMIVHHADYADSMRFRL